MPLECRMWAKRLDMATETRNCETCAPVNGYVAEAPVTAGLLNVLIASAVAQGSVAPIKKPMELGLAPPPRTVKAQAVTHH